ncbi:hypothetical protein [Spirillospora sp. NPDC047279]|uniref:hypothetical protein n=1 Tax=Spirillospora sp. NPDC047279 TaxID=3155478 RepID=UPI0033F25856
MAPAQSVTAESSAAAAGSGVTAAAPCRKAASANGDTVRLWYCNGTGGTKRGYHGQALLNKAGNEITLRSSSGTVMTRTRITYTGVLHRWFNTKTIPGPGPFRACTGHMGATGTCTRLAR